MTRDIVEQVRAQQSLAYPPTSRQGRELCDEVDRLRLKLADLLVCWRCGEDLDRDGFCNACGASFARPKDDDGRA